VIVKERVCCLDIEMLSVGFRAFYAPREFPYTVVIVVYIPPRAAPTTACDIIHDAVARIQIQHPEAFIAITGDISILLPDWLCTVCGLSNTWRTLDPGH